MNSEEKINEIIEEYEFLTERSRNLINQINNVFQTKEKLRAEYTELTGKDISERHNIK